MTRTDAGRLAAFLAVATGLLLSPALAHGHQLRAPEEAVIGRQHMKVSRHTWLGRLRRTGRLRVRVTIDEDAHVDVRLLRRKRRLARIRGELAAGTHPLYLRPSKAALRWLRRADSPRLRFSATAVDAAENGSRWTRRLKPAARR